MIRLSGLQIIFNAPAHVIKLVDLQDRSPAPTQSTFIHVLAAGWPRVPGGASADGLAIDRVGVTVGSLVAGVADACIVEVAQQT